MCVCTYVRMYVVCVCVCVCVCVYVCVVHVCQVRLQSIFVLTTPCKVEAANLYILELFRRPAHRALSLFFYQTESVGCTFWKGTFTEDELAARCAGPKLTPSIDAWVKIPNAPSFVQSYLKHTQGTSHSPEDARLRLQVLIFSLEAVLRTDEDGVRCPHIRVYA